MSASRTVAARDLIRFFRPAAIGFLFFLAGCATGGGNPFVESTNVDAFRLRVESRNTYEVSVYLSVSGRRELVGTVPGNGLQYFEFEYPASRPLYIELETQLGDRYRVPPPPLSMGGLLDLYIYDELRRSVYGG
jgi:hypothetical protein